MRIENEQINQGYFWLPSNPNKKIPGTLSIKNGGKVELEVIGHFDDGFATLTEQIDLNRIIGLVENHNLITLEKCFYKNKNFYSAESPDPKFMSTKLLLVWSMSKKNN